jgi:hypothetical protein
MSDVLDLVRIWNESDDPHLYLAHGTLQRVYFVDALHVRGPTTLANS